MTDKHLPLPSQREQYLQADADSLRTDYDRLRTALKLITASVGTPWWKLGREAMSLRLQTVDRIARAALRDARGDA